MRRHQQKKKDKVAKSTKFDDLQIENGALADLGKDIVARLQRMRDYEAAAKEKAGHELKKANDLWDSIAKMLADAKAQCKGTGFKVFKAKYCSNLGRSRIYEILAIGFGRKTVEETRAASNERKMKHRKASATVRSTIHGTDRRPTALEIGNRESTIKATAPAGNDVDTDASSAAMKVAHNTADDAPAEAGAPVKVELTPEERSDDALTAFKQACQMHLPIMTEADRRQARVYFTENKWMPRRKREVART